MKARWLERSLFVAPYFTLCTTEAMFQRELKHLEVAAAEWPKFLSGSRSPDATTHFFELKGKVCAIVCMHPKKLARRGDGVLVAGLLFHEATHIWQEAHEGVGEKFPSSEFEAYAIQCIGQRLLLEYMRQTNVPTKQAPGAAPARGRDRSPSKARRAR